MAKKNEGSAWDMVLDPEVQKVRGVGFAKRRVHSIEDTRLIIDGLEVTPVVKEKPILKFRPRPGSTFHRLVAELQAERGLAESGEESVF